MPVSTPPTHLDECFFFISLVVKLPYSSIFCRFWLFFVFKLLLSFFWLCEEAQCVYQHLHLGWKSQFANILLRILASMFVSDIGLKISFFVMSLSGFEIRMILAS